MNSTHLHYREACQRLSDANYQREMGAPQAADRLVAEANVHAALALTTAIVEMTRQADPEAVATAVGVLRPIPGGRT